MFQKLGKPNLHCHILTILPFETELSDFHKLTFTVLKAYFQKQKPKVI